MYNFRSKHFCQIRVSMDEIRLTADSERCYAQSDALKQHSQQIGDNFSIMETIPIKSHSEMFTSNQDAGWKMKNQAEQEKRVVVAIRKFRKHSPCNRFVMTI